MHQIVTVNKKPLKLALGISDSTILVWAEIEDNDEQVEDALLIAEAKTTGNFIKMDFILIQQLLKNPTIFPFRHITNPS